MSENANTLTELTSSFMSLISRADAPRGEVPEFLRHGAVSHIPHFHSSVPGYAPTPLVRLGELAERLGVRAVYVKDESGRFGLGAFKGLGVSYALAALICGRLGLDVTAASFPDLLRPELRARLTGLEFATATDGNHGRGLAWAAGLLGCRTHVYMPAGSSEARARAIREAGPAEVEITDLSYDGAVRRASELCNERGWLLVQDTSWPGYEEIPSYIVQGYTTMGSEIAEQLAADGAGAPTHLFLQAGVGAMAGALTGYFAGLYGDSRPAVTVVEPEGAACVYASAKAGRIESVDGGGTIMAGLNCGTPCGVTWPVLRSFVSHYISCSDLVTCHGMRLLAHPSKGDAAIVSGESGAVTAGVLSLVMERPELRNFRERLGLGPDSVVLLISTEGATDPEAYRKITAE